MRSLVPRPNSIFIPRYPVLSACAAAVQCEEKSEESDPNYGRKEQECRRTSCECERSASTLRRLNNFIRASMGKERLSALAIVHTRYDMVIDTEEAVNIFARLHARKLELKTSL